MANQWETEAARGAANDAAQNAYNQGMLELGNAQLAFQKAQQAWKETMEKAGLTGTFEGMPTQSALQYGAEAFGVWGAPQQGQETLASRQQTWKQAFDTSGQFGQYMGPGGPQAGQQTMAGQEQQFTQGLRTQQQQLAEEAQRQQTANQYLTLLGNLRGPADWAKYQQVLGATPGGMQQLVGAAMGSYIPGGGATTGVQPQAANLQTLQGQVYGGGQGGWMGQPQPYQNQYQQPNAAQQTYAQLQGQTNPQAAAGQRYGPVSGTGQQAYDPNQAYTQQMGNNQAQNAMGGGTNMMGATQPQYEQPNLPAPNQIAPQAWNNLAPSQKEMLMGQYEAQGWHKPDVEALRTQALPKMAANAPSAGTWRLRG